MNRDVIIACDFSTREQTLAFLDLAQLNPGHTLVVVKRHGETLFDITPDEAAAAMRTAQRVARAIRQALAARGDLRFKSGVALAAA